MPEPSTHDSALRGQSNAKLAGPRKQAYRWKGRIAWSQQSLDGWPFITAYRRVHLPQALGIGDDGLWRWPLPAVELDVGVTAELGVSDEANRVVELEPVVRLKTRALESSFGVVAALQVLPSVSLSVQHRSHAKLGCLALCCSSKPGTWTSGMVTLELRSHGWHSKQLQLGCSLRSRGGAEDEDEGVHGGSKWRSTGELGNSAFVKVKSRQQPRKGCWLSMSATSPAWRAACESRDFALSNDLTVKNSGGGGGGDQGSILVSGPRPIPLSGFPLSSVGISIALLGDRFGRDVQSLDIIGSETQRWQFQGGKRGKGIKAGQKIGVVAGHWIDPGGDTGAPGERQFNMEVANAVDSQLSAQGWRVYRPDRDTEGLAWDDYLRWVARQSRRGTPVVEIHGQGQEAAIDGVATGVIGCRDAPMNRVLGSSFGFFPMDWRGLAVPRQGGVIVESFVTEEIADMSDAQRGKMAKQLGSRISDAVRRASVQVRSNPMQVGSGCSQTGCPIGKYGHELEAEGKGMMEPSHPLALSPTLKESLGLPEAAYTSDGS